MRPTTASVKLKPGQGMSVIKSVLPYLWPKGRGDIKLRVILSMIALIVGEILGVMAPFFY